MTQLTRTSGFGRSAILIGILAASTPSFAQHTRQAAPPAQHQHGAEESTVALLRSREASGTAWLPDETPMHGIQRTWGEWEVMLHGIAFAQFLYEPGDRHRTGGFSSRQVGSVNWGMVMVRRPLGDGRVGLRAMGSIEPWTVTECGFLNLLATGEMCEGDTIHDRQHPHELFMKLAAEYERPLRGSLRWQIYAGLSGEPALAPPGFHTACQRHRIPSRRFRTTGSTRRTSHSDSSPLVFTIGGGRRRCRCSMDASQTKTELTLTSTRLIQSPADCRSYQRLASLCRYRLHICMKQRQSSLRNHAAT